MDLTAGKINVASSAFHDAATSTDFSASLLVRTLHDLAPSSQSPACYGTWMAYLLRSAAHTGEHSNKHCTQHRQAIVETAAAWGVTVTPEQISAAKAKGNANNDWRIDASISATARAQQALSLRFIEAAGKTATLEQVTNTFEEVYQGTATKRGLCTLETLIPAKCYFSSARHSCMTLTQLLLAIGQGVLEELNRRLPHGMGVVTGRPRKDCNTFIKAHGLDGLFNTCVCMEDGPPKPDPFPVVRCAELMGVPLQETVLIGDTPDDIAAVIAAGGRGIGVRTPLDQAHAWLDGRVSALVAGMQQAGAMCIIEPGCAALLDLVASTNGTANCNGSASASSSSSATANARHVLMLHGVHSFRAVVLFIIEGVRTASVRRKTNETSISVDIDLDGTGKAAIATGLGFLDHMFHAMAKHGRLDLTVKHRSPSRCASSNAYVCNMRVCCAYICAVCAYSVKALARAVVDISSRPHAEINLALTREMIGTISTEMLPHVLESFAQAARITLHVDVLKGFNCHHKVRRDLQHELFLRKYSEISTMPAKTLGCATAAESAFKATGVALRQAISADASAGVPSTKGFIAVGRGFDSQIRGAVRKFRDACRARIHFFSLTPVTIAASAIHAMMMRVHAHTCGAPNCTCVVETVIT
eukprot:2095-Heterococcus_DN1.PRE.4